MSTQQLGEEGHPQDQLQPPEQHQLYDTEEVSSSSSEEESDVEGEEIISVKKRFELIATGLREKTISLRDKPSLDDFVKSNSNYLHRIADEDGEHNTLLHLLIYDAKDKVFERYRLLIGYLIKPHPDNQDLLKVTDNDGKTPLYRAIAKKRDKLVHFLCENHPDIDSVLSVTCHLTNCLHVAITGNVPTSLVTFLIGKASEKTLCAQDSNGCTPLHLAVDYARCTESQLDVVKSLIAQSDLALDKRTNAPLAHSPYRHHQNSRELKAKDYAKSSKKSSQAVTKDGPLTEPTGALSSWKTDLGYKPPTSAVPPDLRAARPSQGHKDEARTPTDSAPNVLRMPQRTNTMHDAVSAMPGPLNNISKVLKEPVVGENPPGQTEKSKVSSSSKGTKEKKRRSEREVQEPTEEAANAIRDYLKLHCLRTRSHDQTIDFLYGRSPGK